MFPDRGELARALRPEVAVYHAWDHLYATPGYRRPAQRERIRRLEEAAAENADVVFTTSRGLHERFEPLSRRCVYLGQGVPELRADEHAPEFDALPPGRRTALFVGTLDDYKVDSGVLRLIADDPDIEVFLLGPAGVNDAATSINALRGHPRVHFLGPRPPLLARAYMSRADLLLIPYRASPYTDGVEPMKLVEYFLSGAPVLASGIRVPHEFAQLVYSAEDRSLTSALRQAVREPVDDGRRAERRRIAAERAWPQVVDRALEVVGEVAGLSFNTPRG
jgi:glycosyltransferase involved in cell wall biosynthesis